MSDLGRVKVKHPGGAPSDRCEIRPAKDFTEYCQSLRLAHDQYTASGLMQEKPSKLRLFLRDLLPTSTVFVAVDGEYMFGTVAGNIYNPGSLPLEDMYSGELQELCSRNRIVAEGTKLACAEITSFEKRGLGGLSTTSTELLRRLYRWCAESNVSDWLIVVHPRLQKFYQIILGFHPMGPLLPCTHVANNPGVLLGLDIHRLSLGQLTPTEAAKEIFLTVQPFEILSVESYHLKAYEVALLLMEDIDILNTAPISDLLAVSNFYPTLNMALIREVDMSAKKSSPYERPSLLSSVIQLESSVAGIKTKPKIGMNPVCFALRAHFNRLQVILEMMAQEEGMGLNLVVEDDVPDSIIADPIFMGHILMLTIGEKALPFSIPPSLREHEVSIEVSGTALHRNDFELSIKVENLITVNKAALEASLQDVKDVKWSFTEVGRRMIVEYKFPAIRVELSPPQVFKFNDGMSSLQKNAPPVERIRFPSLKVLVVEDNTVNQVIMKRVLGKMKVDVTIAPDGLAALNYVEKSKFDLILLDVQLPKFSGFEVAQTIRQWEARGLDRTPIYAMTSFVMREDEERCIESGMDGYLPKPISHQMLTQVLTSIYQQRINKPPKLRRVV